MTGITKIGNMTQASAMIDSALRQNETKKFDELIKKQRAAVEQDKIDAGAYVSSNQIAKDSRLSGDFATGFSGSFTGAEDKSAAVRGSAANAAGLRGNDSKIDRTSKLYEKSLELESFFVKIMVSSMRKTVYKRTKNSFAKSMYEDMLYDEYTTALTKNAGFGIADQIYLQLDQKA